MSRPESVSHAFVICAYKESPYLEACIQSLVRQSVKSEILMVTSTPNENIRVLAEKYGLPLKVNTGESGLAGDWNFALGAAEADLITIAHQDDVYMEEYTSSVLSAYQKCKNPIILFTDYYELRGKDTVKSNQLLRVKRFMLLPLRWRPAWGSRFVRRRILSMGSAICCPSVTLVKKRVPEKLFRNNMKSNIDWQAWEELSKKRGSFAYIARPLMKHRIHKDSTTSELLAQSARKQEDLYMYQKFWPKPIAEFIEFFYCRNEKSNHLEK